MFINRIIARTVLISSVIVAIATMLGASVYAAGSGSGYQISPLRTDVTLNPGQSHVSTVYIKNVTADPETLQAVADDFLAKNETGAPALLLNGENAPKHGLKKYMTVPSEPFTLQPGQQAPVNVSIAIPAGLPGGGYFGAVRFEPATLSGQKTVNLSASVASLFLVKVNGTVTEKMSIASFGVSQNGNGGAVFTTNKNIVGYVRFQNEGDLQEEPFGKMNLMKGSNTVASYEINNTDPKGNVLPDSIRRFEVHLDKVGSFGKYKLQGNFGYGANGQLLTAQTTFYVIPVSYIVTAVVIIIVLLLLIFGLPRALKARDQRTLAKARQQK